MSSSPQQSTSNPSSISRICTNIAHAINTLIYSRKYRLIFAAILTVVLFALMTLTNRYAGGSDDDWSISLDLSGRYPNSGLCLFINALISQASLALNLAFPAFNWFLFLEFLIAFFAFFCVVYGALTYMKPLFAFLLIGAVECFILPGCTYEGNFTFVAGIATLAGFILLVGSTKNRSASKLIPTVGVIFCVLGFMLRWEAFLLCLPFVALSLFFIFLHRKSDRPTIAWHQRISSFLRASIPYVAVVILCSATFIYDALVWQQPEWKAWLDFNNVRSELVDYPMPAYDKVADELAAHGISEADYRAPQQWVTADPEVFTVEKLEYMASLTTALSPADRIQNIKNYVKADLASFPHHILIVIAIAVVALLASRKTEVLPHIVIALGFAAIIWLYFATTGRLPERVESLIWLFALIAIFLSVKHNAYDNDPDAKQSALATANTRRETIATASGGVLWGAATALVLSLTVPMFNPSLIGAYLNQDTYQPNNPVAEYAARDDGRINVWGISSFFEVEDSYRLKFLPSEELLAKNFFLGGWSDRAPFTMANRERVNMGNAVKGLADNPNAYLVISEAADGYLPEFTLTLIKQHYYPDATMEVVETFQGANPDDVYQVWKFHSNA
ncbi:MAG: hypothetical protein ACLU06_03460 [Eggerthellaceae bacterium]